MNRTMNPGERSTILVVDDTPDNLALVSALLKDSYKVKVANNGEKALSIARSATPPDLILLDIMMPGLDGYAVCRELKSHSYTRDIPIIFLTALNDIEDERKGLELGAVDYILKPISASILLARVKTHLELKAVADFLRDQNTFLDKEVQRRTMEVLAVQEVTILALASLAETRDTDTGNHLRRTQHYVKTLATELKKHQAYAEDLSDSVIEQLFKSSPLHDIGKVGIPDRILLKPGKLDPGEFEIMTNHSRLGHNAIEHAEQSLGSPVQFLSCAKQIALYHHEKWDGTGYPEQLAGEAIPLSARIMAIADVYDALISRRVYKEGMPADKAAGIIAEGAGTHFDPVIVEAFKTTEPEFRAIAGRFLDTDADFNRLA